MNDIWIYFYKLVTEIITWGRRIGEFEIYKGCVKLVIVGSFDLNI